MHVIGLDLSYTATGVAHPDGTVSRIVTTSTQADHLRWRAINDAILELVQQLDAPCIIVIEDLPAARAHNIARLGMLHGVIRNRLHYLITDRSVTAVVFVPPAVLKRYATGRGNAGKAEVLAEAIRRLGYAGSDDNEADAMWLRQLGLAHYAPDQAAVVPAAHKTALNGVRWPDLEEQAA